MKLESTESRSIISNVSISRRLTFFCRTMVVVVVVVAFLLLLHSFLYSPISVESFLLCAIHIWFCLCGSLLVMHIIPNTPYTRLYMDLGSSFLFFFILLLLFNVYKSLTLVNGMRRWCTYTIYHNHLSHK